jgi:hypothetical protein
MFTMYGMNPRIWYCIVYVAVRSPGHRLQNTLSAGPVCFLIFSSISIFLLASLVAGRRPQYIAGADFQGMYFTINIHWNFKSAPASPGRSRVGQALYVFSLLGADHAVSIHLKSALAYRDSPTRFST